MHLVHSMYLGQTGARPGRTLPAVLSLLPFIKIFKNWFICGLLWGHIKQCLGVTPHYAWGTHAALRIELASLACKAWAQPIELIHHPEVRMLIQISPIAKTILINSTTDISMPSLSTWFVYTLQNLPCLSKVALSLLVISIFLTGCQPSRNSQMIKSCS